IGRKRAEQALMASEKLWRGMFDNNRAIQLLIDAEDGRIIEANPAAADFYGYPRQMLQEMRIWQINTLSEREVREKTASARSGARFKFHFGHRLRDGTVREVEVFSSPVP
ncbi:MAG: PAS domain-containing protein, partial [Deltaproteobacteria bacterium]|nr:PAS domain-containing protein [Deltaproteobacteria bacterium]